MSSADESSHPRSSDNETPPDSRASSRGPSRSHTPATPRKRRRTESVERSRVRKYPLEGKYNDAYRVLFNEHVSRAAARFEPAEGVQHYSTQYGASVWSAQEQATLFAALERLGRDDVPGVARAIGTKSPTETRELLLLLGDAATKQQNLGLTMRDVPAAIELGHACAEELDVVADALAWYQEQFEVAQEQERYGHYWLITPALAQDIEAAINRPSRAASTRPTTPAEPGTPRAGPGIAGSCVRCKLHKIRCDRNVPCGNCAHVKKKVVCQYKSLHQDTRHIDLTPQTPNVEGAQEQPAELAVSTAPPIVHAIPQAALLHAENMLSLSKILFMNRSADIPSPWPHWSAYASEQVPEPSILRTAFNDFHTLAVSVTKRLMQAAIMQATSRLRSQRRRTKKGVMPLVKTRDVLSAIDVLGLKRNARSRWTGVARRCNVRVFDEQRTTRFKIKQREISWEQAEQILGLYDAVAAPPANDAHASGPATDTDGDEAFRQRAARSGTPLPMEHLSLSNPDTELETDDVGSEYDSAPSDEMKDDFTEHVQHPNLVTTDGNMSIAPGEADQNHIQDFRSLEHFDQEASRQEEEALCNLLGLSTYINRKSPVGDASEDESVSDQGNITTSADDWRKWTEYQATWAEFHTPVPSARFVANRKPRKASPNIRPRRLGNAGDASAGDSDASSTSSQVAQRPRQRMTGVVELRTRDPRAYAAMQSTAFGIPDDASRSDPSGTDDNLDADVPAQSVENTEIAQNPNLSDAMDWET
ncbi:uncharacterized protein EKO05_0000741 [Ascochyta rabiei]|uniref:Sequence-specific DNA binding RNA polymerase II transcription factor n=1 Tax=Didymella rabiei TaxID=5454 RepID=A0A163B4L1_DIDRA|nr:uncharacterized protein EKO05_0000741 [Ascochyta rabiei]KZM21569.1 sequence-specific DNA binding RNA polymerase II transcription factor [Ascochyta rabiei]UPX10069.1 hypothetical protein EKO05_0000741 [Ascochyta rabiei]